MLRFARQRIPTSRGSAGRRHHSFPRHHHLQKRAHWPRISYDTTNTATFEMNLKGTGHYLYLLFLKEGSAKRVRACLCVTGAFWPRSCAGGGGGGVLQMCAPVSR